MGITKDLACDDKLFQHIRNNLENFDIRTHDKKGRQAAVALTVVETGFGTNVYGMSASENWRNDSALVLTQRASKLRKHAGQWALPGGSLDKGESPEEAALRELQEEVGLELGHERVMGRLDDYTTRSGFTISPVVVWGGAGVELIRNPDEVDSIHRIPIAEFLRKDAPILEDIPESKNPVLLMPVGYSWIASPTASILYQFREVGILGNKTRVAHFEQPYFAWQ